MAAQQLEQILALLLQPDNAVIQQATARLKEVLKQPAALSHLCHVMTSSQDPQPDIARFSDEIMPLLLRYLEGVHPAHTTHLAKAYYALRNFVENLEDKIAPYLPALMERMLNALTSPGTPRTKELAVSALGPIGRAIC